MWYTSTQVSYPWASFTKPLLTNLPWLAHACLGFLPTRCLWDRQFAVSQKQAPVHTFMSSSQKLCSLEETTSAPQPPHAEPSIAGIQQAAGPHRIRQAAFGMQQQHMAGIVSKLQVQIKSACLKLSSSTISTAQQYYCCWKAQERPLLQRAMLRAMQNPGWETAGACWSLGLGRETLPPGHRHPETPSRACSKALALFYKQNHTCAIGAAWATTSTRVFPTATVSSQPACSTDFMLAGDWKGKKSLVSGCHAVLTSLYLA